MTAMSQTLVTRNAYGNSGRFSKRISAYLTGPARAQLNLSQELAVARAMLSDVVEVYEAATEETVDPKTAMLQKLAFQEKLGAAVELVAKTAKTWAEIESKITIEPAMVASLANTIQTVLQAKLPPETLCEIEADLGTIFANLDVKANRPAILSPADTIKALDDAVPREGLSLDASTSSFEDNSEQENVDFAGTNLEAVKQQQLAHRMQHYQAPPNDWVN